MGFHRWSCIILCEACVLKSLVTQLEDTVPLVPLVPSSFRMQITKTNSVSHKLPKLSQEAGRDMEKL